MVTAEHGSDAEELPSGELARVQMALDLRKFHHTSIWEEQKHFTWLISLLLSAQIISVFSGRLNSITLGVVLLIGSLLGMLLSLIAFKVQRREGQYYGNAYFAFAKEWNLQFPQNRLPDKPVRANKGVLSLVASGLAGTAGIRDYFQILFVSFGAAFLAVAVYSGASLWPVVNEWITRQGWL